MDLGRSPAAARFGSEFVAAVNKVNYNQGNTLNALAGQYTLLLFGQLQLKPRLIAHDLGRTSFRMHASVLCEVTSDSMPRLKLITHVTRVML